MCDEIKPRTEPTERTEICRNNTQNLAQRRRGTQATEKYHLQTITKRINKPNNQHPTIVILTMRKILVKYKYRYIAFIIVAGGIVVMLLRGFFSDPSSFGYKFFTDLGSAILVSGVISFISQIMLKKEFDLDLAEKMKISESINSSGLTTILTDASKYDYTEIMMKARNFCVIINDGKRWVENHSQKLKDRFDKTSNTTEFFIVNPEGPFFKALAVKTNKNEEELRAKIENTITLLKEIYSESKKKSKLNIYYLKNYPTQTLFYSDNKVVVTPYQTSSGRNTIPLYEYSFKTHKESIGKHLNEDLKKVREESTLIWEGRRN